MDDWDLHAVVRGCAAASTTTTATDIPILPSFSTADFQNPLDFLKYDNNDHFRGLREVSREFGSDHAQTPATTTCATGSISVTAAHNIFDHPRQYIMQILKPQLRMDNLHIQENIQFSNPGIGSSLSHNLPAKNPQPNRQRRIKKNQQMKIVRQITLEELSADSWAWRKYGQKPIKGSAYPS
ncbi:WRKY transcription factor [Orobanche gracilis]